MLTKEILVKEFEFRVFNESYERIYKCLSLINDQQLWWSPSSKIPTVGNLILHLTGNARQWILSGLGGRPDNRNRDEEFIVQEKIKKSELVFLLETMKSHIRQELEDLDEYQLTAIHAIQGFQVSGFSVLIHVIEHFSYHTGQITTLTKLMTDQETGYYNTFNLNKRNFLN